MTAPTKDWEPAGPIGDALAAEALDPLPRRPVRGQEPTSAGAEIAALTAVYETLAPLDDPTRARIISWMQDRLLTP